MNSGKIPNDLPMREEALKSYARAKRRDPNEQWNPMKSNGRMNARSFALSILFMSVLLYMAGALISARVLHAKLTLQFDDLSGGYWNQAWQARSLLFWYFAWLALCFVGFYVVSNTYIKRWSEILNDDNLGRKTKLYLRIALLSPLLAIYTLLLTLACSRKGPVKEPTSLSALLPFAIALFAVFHITLIGVRLQRGEIVKGEGAASLKTPEKSMTPGRSLLKVLPDGALVRWLPGEGFYVHVFPYLNPITKYVVTLYTDYVRVTALFEEATVPDSPLCQLRLGYIGVPVKDCFFYNYRKTAQQLAFMTPIYGLYFESRYRQLNHKYVNSHDPFSGFATNFLSLNNFLALAEPGYVSKDRRDLIEPVGLLKAFASPELPALELGQDLQRHLFAVRLLPVLRDGVQKLEKTFSESASFMPIHVQQAAQKEMRNLMARAAVLSSDPLGIAVISEKEQATEKAQPARPAGQ